MRIISKLSEMIEDEIDGAEEYIMSAYETRESYPSVSKLLYTLANEELGHVERIHNAVVGEINAYKSEHGDPPESMQTLYNYLHKRHIDKTAKVKAMVGSYK